MPFLDISRNILGDMSGQTGHVSHWPKNVTFPIISKHWHVNQDV